MTMSPPAKSPAKKPDLIDLEPPENSFSGFEFCLDHPVNVLPADELFSNGKLMPLRVLKEAEAEAAVVETPKVRRRNEDPCLFSPKAPKCSSRWKEMLGLRRLNQREKENRKSAFSSTASAVSAASAAAAAKKSIKSFLNRSSKSAMIDSSLSLPLLKDSDTESVSVSSSRMSLSSSSSGHEHDDLPRLSLDSEIKQSSSTLPRVSVTNSRKFSSSTASTSSAGAGGAGVRVSRSRMRKQEANSRGVSVDSPRMNSSGKIVFHSLERSSSTPSSNGGGRYKNKGIERSYSANVRITAVPVCSLRRSSKSGVVFGFPLFSSSQQSSNGSSRSNRLHHHHHHQQQSLQQKNSNIITKSRPEN